MSVAVRLWVPLLRAAGRVAPGAAAIGGGGAQQRGAVVDLDRAVGLRPCRPAISVFSLVMSSPTMPLSGENEAIVGATGRRRVDGHGQCAEEAAPVLPAASVAVRR